MTGKTDSSALHHNPDKEKVQRKAIDNAFWRFSNHLSLSLKTVFLTSRWFSKATYLLKVYGQQNYQFDLLVRIFIGRKCRKEHSATSLRVQSHNYKNFGLDSIHFYGA